MKIFLCIFSRNDAILNISGTLRNMGNEVYVFATDSYRLKCAYIEKKLDKLGFNGKRKRFESQWKSNFVNAVKEIKTAKCIFVNTPNDLLSVEDMHNIRVECLRYGTKMVVWFVDPVGDRPDFLEHCKFFDKIICI